MPRLQCQPLHRDFGAKITGIDMQPPLDADLLAEVGAAIETYALLWFPDQSFDDARQLALTRQFGEPEPGHVPAGKVNSTSIVSGIDFLPTICGILGIPLENKRLFEGLYKIF